GNVLPQTTAAGWAPVWQAVAEFIAQHRDVIQEREFDVGGRQIRVQLAPLGAAPDGCVIALDDATALTRAARVLAWGEMARQVAQLYDLGSAPRFEVRTSNGAPPPALARKDEVKEVLVNLLENARNADAKRVTVQVAASGRQLVVADDGRGIPPEVLPRVFEPTFSTTSSGAGLGLAIARRLVESWGGAITLESPPGKGTRVTLTLQTAS